MKAVLFFLLTAILLVTINASCGNAPINGASKANANTPQTAAKKSMRPFRSEQELAGYFKEVSAEQKREQARWRESQKTQTTNSATADSVASATPSTNASGLAAKAPAAIADAKAGGDDESVTNVQTTGVDEGDIVKLHGNHLLMLRRGRLFTVAIGDGALKPISSSDAFGPDINPSSTWYDEMLISGDTVAVIGYSYERGGTEIGIFNVDADGHIAYRSTYHLRSNDYYSSRNYASRLIGSKLIFYTPLYLPAGDNVPLESFPALRKWHKGATAGEFKRIVTATRIYRPEQPVSGTGGLALHTVTVCDLARTDMTCEATAVIGAPGRVFYVSPDSVYVWTSNWARYGDASSQRSLLYRMPLDGSSPSALGVTGSPVDQFSFLESEDAHLNVLVRSGAGGETMWDSENAGGDVSLMRVTLQSFSDGSEAAPASSYQQLPEPTGYTFQNRFVGDYLLYGTGSGWGEPETRKRGTLYAVRWAGGDVAKLPLAHGVDRIEVMGHDAVVVGTDGEDLYFTGVRLGEDPSIASSYKRKGASQGELRSHGFFYKPDGDDSGLLGLPISEPGRAGYQHLFNESASILYLRNDSLQLKELGNLAAHPERATDDACKASCVDWYGNSRPLFVRGRVFALLGYELVEGRLTDGRIRETRRISYAPQRQRATRS